MIAITSIRPTVAQPVATQWFAIALAPTAQRATFGLRDDVRQAAQLVQQSLDTIRRVPSNDQGSEGTKDARIAAFHLNTSAQALLEPHFTGTDAATLSVLRTA
ncbi:MAG: hypothetical protein JWM98_611, partial [Thermoleophilia bacterium]|nr:hypothetical protein [Thermoleophilia bacterium]